MEADSFSIVIPTHNRSAMVTLLLQTLSIARARFTGTVEILVIDSSENDEAATIRNLCAVQSVHYLRCANRVCKKRNMGIQQARGEYVLFADSDCEVSPDILEQHARVYRSVGEGVGGVLGLTTISGDLAPIWRTLELDSSFTAAFSFARWLEYAPWGTCTNISFRRQVLLQVGGFDENWPLVVYGEDVDLGLRVKEAGFRIQCNPQALVEHNSTSISSMRQVLRKKYLSGRADYHLGRKHPACLTPEFPGWPGMTLLLFFVLLLRCLGAHSLLPMLWGAVCLSVGVLCQAILTARASRTGEPSALRHAAVILFEATFELGRLIESLRHGEVKRLWTKFVYIERQLVGERDKRIRQMWACVFAFLCLLVLLGTVPSH
jgi:glycosyltransferase involved in cell wall biosynthesis